ncbi:polysaccharide biosynthesis protein [Caballeronia peredens]|nr:polysaccharide biosynthesis protein [Caballeronia peredens]
MMRVVRKGADTTSASGTVRVGRNVTVMVLSFVGNYAAALATFPYLTRVLGPLHFGMLAYAMAIAAYGTLLTEWGISLSGPRAVIVCRDDDPSRLNALIWSVFGAKTLLCVAGTLMLVVLLAFDIGGAAARPVIWLSWLGVIASVCRLYWLFQGLERFKLIGWMIFVNRAVTLPLTFWLVKEPQDVATAAAIQVAGPVIAAAFSILIAINEGLLRRPEWSWRSIIARLTEGADMFVATASVTLFGAANAIILTSYSGTYAAGIYAGADKIRTICTLVPAQLGAVLYPRIGRMFKYQRRQAARLTAYGVAFTLLISLCGAAMSIAFAEPITRIVLGEGFDSAANVLRVLALSTVFGNVAYFLGLQILVPSGASKLRSMTILTTGCMNVVFALLLVRHFAAMGAAISFLVCEALILAAYVALIVRSPRLRRYLSLCAIRRRPVAVRKGVET